MFYRPDLDAHGLERNPFKALVAPRPIAWVSTLDGDGRANLAPYSFFNAVSEAPPILMFAPYGPKSADLPERKDTLANVLETGEFVVNVVPLALIDAMNASSAPLPRDADEFAAAGVTPAPSEVVSAPRVAESPVSFECRFLTRTELPSNRPDIENGVIFGEVVGVHIDDAVIVGGRVDLLAYRPLARLGYLDYASVDETFELERPGGTPNR